MTVSQFFRFLHVRRQILDGYEFVNKLTDELIYKDPYWDTEEEWAARGVHNVCCLGSRHHCGEDRDEPIDYMAWRIATERGWELVQAR